MEGIFSVDEVDGDGTEEGRKVIRGKKGRSVGGGGMMHVLLSLLPFPRKLR